MKTDLLRLFGTVAFELLGELVAPLRCVACEELVRMRTLFCSTCLLAVERAPPPVLREANAVFAYGGAVATAVQRFKYEGRSDLAPRLATLMATEASRLAAVAVIDAVVPVPLHPKRIAERGFDQSALLARPIARSLEVPLHLTAIERVRDTPRQASLDRSARVENVAAAFRPRRTAERLIGGKHVLLVDDVATTGSTLAACGAALRKGGVNRVTTLVLARKGLDL